MLGAGAGAGAVSWLCTWWRQVAGAGAGAVICLLQVVETGCWCWCWVSGTGAGAGAVSWLCTWWRQVAGAGCRVPGAGAGAGAVSWLCTWWRQVAGWCWCRVPCWSGAGAAAGVVSWQSAPVLVSADCARCGGAVSWPCRLRAFLFQPVACQQVAGFCLAIWVCLFEDGTARRTYFLILITLAGTALTCIDQFT